MMLMNRTIQLRQHPDVTTHPLDDELVLYDARNGQAFVLNSTAARIWALCDGSRTTNTVARAIATDYGITNRRALTDVRELAAELCRADLLAS
jgi:hypothetical protein